MSNEQTVETTGVLNAISTAIQERGVFKQVGEAVTMSVDGFEMRLNARQSAAARRVNVLSEAVDHILGNSFDWMERDGEDSAEIATWSERLDYIRKSRSSIRFDTPIARGANAMMAWMFSDLSGLDEVTTNEALSETVERILGGGDVVSEYTHLLKNAERLWLTDGGMAVRYYVEQSTPANIVIMRQDITELDFSRQFCNPDNRSQVWLHLRTYREKGADKDTLIYYPDAAFYPETRLRNQLSKYVQSKKFASAYNLDTQPSIDWTKRISYWEVNDGIPIIYPAIAYADCLALIPQLEMAKLQLLASIAAHYDTKMSDTVGDIREGLEQIARANGANNDPASYATVGQDTKVSTLNINVAMLQDDAAVVTLLKWFLQSAFPALRPESWPSSEASSLGNSSGRNTAIIYDARMRRNVTAGVYRSMIESAIIMLMTLDNGPLRVNGVELNTVTYKKANTDLKGAYNVHRLRYADKTERITVAFPALDEGTLTVADLVALTTLGTKGGPVGSVSLRSFKENAAKLGYRIESDNDEWDTGTSAAEQYRIATAEKNIINGMIAEMERVTNGRFDNTD